MKYSQYPSYKDSGVEWLGEIPEHWVKLAIKRLSPVGRGASPRPIEDPKYFDEEGDYAWVRIADVSKSDGYLNTTKQQLSTLGSSLSVKLQKGDLFISIAGTVGKPCIANIKACIHDGFVYFPLLTEKYVSLIYRIFESGKCYGGLGKMGTQLNLNTETIGNISIAIAPAQEQQIIANYLDKATAKIDALIAKQTRLIELLKEKRQAVISTAVIRGLDSTVAMKGSGVEWLGDIPEHWEVMPLKRLLNKIIDNRGRTPVFGSRGIPMLEIRNITKGKGEPTLDFEKYVDEDIVKEYERDKVKIGDLLISTVGATSGKTVIIKKEPDYFIAQNVVGLRAKDNIEPSYLFYFLNSNYFFTSLMLINKGNTIDNLKVSVFINNTCFLPSVPEQQNIINYLDNQTTKIDNLITKSTKAIVLLKEKRTALISSAVTGKIDVRSYND